MPDSYELTKLDSSSFEHLVNQLALRELGAGYTGFAPGPDGGRDGYYEGEANYPSQAEHWKGRWYIQSKFHKPHLSTDPQKWLIEQIKKEIKAFRDPESERKWPDNWIIASNIDPSGTAMTGSYDKAKELVAKANKKLSKNFHIWGGRKILDLLAVHPEITNFYRHFLTPGHIFTELFEHIKDEHAQLETILRHLIVKQFTEQQYTKLEQAGSEADTRPGIHNLFIDLPFHAKEYDLNGMLIKSLVQTAGNCHRMDATQPNSEKWRFWRKYPSRARVWFVKGGQDKGNQLRLSIFVKYNALRLS